MIWGALGPGEDAPGLDGLCWLRKNCEAVDVSRRVAAESPRNAIGQAIRHAIGQATQRFETGAHQAVPRQQADRGAHLCQQ